MADSGFLGTAQLASRLGVTARTVRRWLKARELPTSPLRSERGKWLVSLDELIARLHRRQAEQAEEETRGD